MEYTIKRLDEVFEACGFMAITYPVFREADFIVGVSRGGLIPAAFISTLVDKPLAVAYIDKQDNVYFDRAEWIKGKKVVIVDDIVRTGKTLIKIRNLILEAGAKEVECAVLGMVEGVCELDPIRHWESKENIVFPWDFDYKNN